VKSKETWNFIHTERSALADTLSHITPEQWSDTSWCGDWSVHKVAGHLVAAAEQTFANFYKELIMAGFKFDTFTDRGADAVASASPEQIVARLRARTTTTNHPPAPVMAMLGEIIVHGDDIRRPLGLVHRPPEEALIAVADSWKKSNLLIGAKRRIVGVSLRATDASWHHGEGPNVEGPLQSLILAMTGRKGSHVDLTGDGVAILASRA
jgi:uncharacterized protein (TIGR03083 family)